MSYYLTEIFYEWSRHPHRPYRGLLSLWTWRRLVSESGDNGGHAEDGEAGEDGGGGRGAGGGGHCRVCNTGINTTLGNIAIVLKDIASSGYSSSRHPSVFCFCYYKM